MEKIKQEKIWDTIQKTRMVLDEMEKELVYQKEHDTIWDKAEKLAKKNGTSIWCCGEYLSWENKEKYGRDGKGNAWFKRRAMIIRDWMKDTY